MVRHISVVVSAVVFVALAGCAAKPAASPPAATPSAAAAAVSSSTAPSSVQPATAPAHTTPPPAAKPLSYYAHQYVTAVGPANTALTAFQNLPDSASMSEDQKYATATAKATTTADNELLRMSWPDTRTTQDIRALVQADSAIAADLTDLAASMGNVAHDAGVENAAVAIVRADLGMPAVTN